MTRRLIPILVLGLLAGPVLAGVLGTLLPALGVTGQPGAFTALLNWPGLPRAAGLSLGTGLAATALSLALTALILAGWSGRRGFGVIERLISPLLSVPHAAAALGLAFLIAPSGWIMRLLSPWATGLDTPPNWLILNDPYGLALTLGLVVKEVPFLLLMSIAALPQTQPRRSALVAATLGYGAATGWLKTVWPRLYPQIRLPVYAVLAYGMSTVDMAIILGPSTPPTLAVEVVRWMNAPDLSGRNVAAAGAVAQLLLVLLALALWRLAEMLGARLMASWTASGTRGHRASRVISLAGLGATGLVAGAIGLGLLVLGLWSVTRRWHFPDALPAEWSLRSWHSQTSTIAGLTSQTMLIAAVSATLAVILVLASLETHRTHPPNPRLRPFARLLSYLPLIIPQVAFLPGLQWGMLQAGLSTGTLAVIAAHLVFVVPYVYLSLSAPYHAWDSRHACVAASLGASDRRIFWRLRLPMLLAPVLTAAAVGLAVSVGQYLPTLVIGGGRVQTLTTEAVALASGGDRRVIGVFALVQTGLVALGFALAIAAPRLLWLNRAGMRHGQ
ncbi:ABC transporter permease [Actibacterium mucosum KCTC 23349]|uniref:ABC transporter permease n=1 Tax=Actibacterium mucosum KCTC 23349 TaxID=1454373 RepID=A0A037ZKB4_9RHOB|nr:ABC transporter permease subunit [Actibacterium mucosum]KAJ56079.1 ABC transporter permease [Actibacterium mucosum KCTC 23349]